MSIHGEAMRALSENRELAFQQSAMTVFGAVPPIQDVREILSDRLAASVGIQAPARPPAAPRAVAWRFAHPSGHRSQWYELPAFTPVGFESIEYQYAGKQT